MPEMTERLKLQNNALENTLEFIEANAKWGFPTIPGDTKKGKKLIICGAGPSLNNAGPTMRWHKGDVWACNSALTYLIDRGQRVTHAIGIDNSKRMYTRVWADPPKDVRYFLASSVDPELIAHLVRNGCRRIGIWHNFTSIKGEYDLYANPELFGPTIIAGEGLNVVNRCLDLAMFMGYSSIHIVGADCGYTEGSGFHAGTDEMPDGRVFLKARPEFGDAIGTPGVQWHSTADMMMSAVDLAKKAQKHEGRITLQRGTLPYYLRKKDDAFMDRIIKWDRAEGSAD